MSSTTGLIFSYIIGLIFLIGGVVFLIGLEENRFLFGIPYLLMGALIVLGIHMSARRRKRRAVNDEDEPAA